MKIDFYIPEDQSIPTTLRLKVDDKFDVYYRRLEDDFGFEFGFFKTQSVDLDMATAITDEIVSKMVSQSYDHGAQWRECGDRKIRNEDFDLSITVFFRVRDTG